MVQKTNKRGLNGLGFVGNLCVLGTTFIFLFVSMVFVCDYSIYYFYYERYWSITQTKHKLVLCGVFINMVTCILEIHLLYCKYVGVGIVYIDSKLHNVIYTQYNNAQQL